MLRVNEIFPTIQGEATWTGMPATFIRLQGCPVGCSWCDTKHTWPEGSERKRINIVEMLDKVDPAPTWAEMSTEQIVENVAYMQPRHFVITGGEPCAQDIWMLTAKLLTLGSVQVETSGTHRINVAPGTWVTVSPKVGMGGGMGVLPTATARADEIKMPVASVNDIDNLQALLVDRKHGAPVWLQPVSQGDEATQLCIQACMENQWRLSIQTHKYAGVR
jgi:7-carboxy-7-deazaguanine synthase|tara:strand:+ start:656 stop:1312 length:657 start_codon:yes stop_codon:yes gene_type:complete